VNHLRCECAVYALILLLILLYFFCDKCDSPFFVYLSKEKLMMQRQKMFPFIFWSFLQATKENWWRRLQELPSALSIFHECKKDTNMAYLQRWFLALFSIFFSFLLLSVPFFSPITFCSYTYFLSAWLLFPSVYRFNVYACFFFTAMRFEVSVKRIPVNY
jgi:hypothetical protein